MFGSVLIVSSLSFYFLPETKDRTLPSSAEELEIDRGESILRIPRLDTGELLSSLLHLKVIKFGNVYVN